MTEQEVEELTFATLSRWRPEGLYEPALRAGGLEIRWGRSSGSLGMARYPGPIGFGVQRVRVTFSRPLFARMPEHEQRDTVIHEAAHLLVTDDWFRSWDDRRRNSALSIDPRPEAHGREWRTWMVRMGGQPTARCRDADVAEAGRELRTERRIARGDTVQLTCGCQTFSVTLTRAAKGRLLCRRCRRFLKGSGRDGLAILLAMAAEGKPTELPEAVRARCATFRHWPARSVLRVAER